MDSNVQHDENTETLLHLVDLSCCSDEIVTLSEDTIAVGIYIAGYVAKDYWLVIVELKTLIFRIFKFYQEEVLQFHQQIWSRICG